MRTIIFHVLLKNTTNRLTVFHVFNKGWRRIVRVTALPPASSLPLLTSSRKTFRRMLTRHFEALALSARSVVQSCDCHSKTDCVCWSEGGVRIVSGTRFASLWSVHTSASTGEVLRQLPAALLQLRVNDCVSTHHESFLCISWKCWDATPSTCRNGAPLMHILH